jgi:hypothetical protein
VRDRGDGVRGRLGDPGRCQRPLAAVPLDERDVDAGRILAGERCRQVDAW